MNFSNDFNKKLSNINFNNLEDKLSCYNCIHYKVLKIKNNTGPGCIFLNKIYSEEEILEYLDKINPDCKIFFTYEEENNILIKTKTLILNKNDSIRKNKKIS